MSGIMKLGHLLGSFPLSVAPLIILSVAIVPRAIGETLVVTPSQDNTGVTFAEAPTNEPCPFHVDETYTLSAYGDICSREAGSLLCAAGSARGFGECNAGAQSQPRHYDSLP